MSKVRRILKLHYEDGLSQRQIAQKLELRSKTTVGDILRKAKRLGVTWPLAPELNDEKLNGLFYKKKSADDDRAPNWQDVDAAVEKNGLTLEQAWMDYLQNRPDGYSYSQFCKLYRRHKNNARSSPGLRIVRPAPNSDQPPEAAPKPVEIQLGPTIKEMEPTGETRYDVKAANIKPGPPETPASPQPADNDIGQENTGPAPVFGPPNNVAEELQYIDFFGFHQQPFPVAPDETGFFSSQFIDQILTELAHGILARKGFMILTGNVGLGKTTISRRLMNFLDEKGVETSLVFHTTYQDVELLREINRDFGILEDKLVIGDQMKRLNDFLLEKNHQGKNCAIIVDDAQNLSEKSLELIRMISNLESDRQKLVQILLIGQPELLESLNRPTMRQVKSRIIIRKETREMNPAELADYLAFKMEAVGNRGQVRLHNKAVKMVHRKTRGNFRKVNILMDRCLYVAYLLHTREITPRVVLEAWDDLRLLDSEPSKSASLFRRMILLVVLACLAAAWAIGGGMPDFRALWHGAPGRTEIAAPRPVKATPPAKPVAAPESKAQSEPAPVAETPLPASVPRPIADFLTGYGLGEYGTDFLAALESMRFGDLSARIADNSGYQLIRLAEVPENVRSRFGVLTYPSPSGELYHYLFWQPHLKIEHFYYKYNGPEIRYLQELLAETGYYNDGIDGIVGKNLMLAVTAFQEDAHLRVTGRPDPEMLFLLYHTIEGPDGD